MCAGVGEEGVMKQRSAGWSQPSYRSKWHYFPAGNRLNGSLCQRWVLYDELELQAAIREEEACKKCRKIRDQQLKEGGEERG